MSIKKTVKPRGRLLGWLKIRGYSIEKVMYLIQRISGVMIVGFLFWHLLDTNQAYLLVPELQILFGVIIIFHALNGVRLVLAEYGFIVGKPIRAVYPYKFTTLRGLQRLSVALVIAAFIILTSIWILNIMGVVG